MDILLTNDDGPFATGLAPLRRRLQDFGHVKVVCPDTEASGVGHAITYMVPVRAQTVHLADGAEATAVSGTPADCVKFALLEVFDSLPDLVVSGVNPGYNVGVDIFYSGTVAAALEGAFYGVSSLAISTSQDNGGAMDEVARQAVRVLRHLVDADVAEPWVFNVNIPRLGSETPPLCFSSQSTAFPPGQYSRAEGSRGRVHYWLDSTTGADLPPPHSDAAALEAGEISITPLRLDLTDWESLDRLRGAAFRGTDSPR